jgi:diguanylate cyclase (GGDEF)-like protein
MQWENLIFGNSYKVPTEWHEDFQKEWFLTCYSRCRVLAWFTLIYPMIIVPVLAYNLLLTEPKYFSVVAANYVGLSVSSLIALTKFQHYKNLNKNLSKNPKSIQEVQKSQKKLIQLFSLVLMIFMNISLLTVWIRTGMSFPYIINIFVFVLIFYQPDKLSLAIYLSNFIFYLIIINTYNYPFHHQSIAYFSGILSMFSGWVVARMLFNSRVQEFIDSRTIQLQSRELQKVNQELIKIATTDGLTQVANRRKFDLHLNLKYQELLDKSTLGILLCDIDYFKLFNDRYGHQAGDYCLKQVAATIQADIRKEGDLVARYGGEEFIIILCNTSEIEAMQIAQRICEQVQNLHISHERSPLAEVTISIGVSCDPSSLYSPEQLISSADRALYTAKSKGRNQAIYSGLEFRA